MTALELVNQYVNLYIEYRKSTPLTQKECDILMGMEDIIHELLGMGYVSPELIGWRSFMFDAQIYGHDITVSEDGNNIVMSAVINDVPRIFVLHYFPKYSDYVAFSVNEGYL